MTQSLSKAALRGRPGASDWAPRLARRPRPLEALIQAGLLGAGAVSILTAAGIMITLGTESLTFFKDVSLWEFLSGTVWQPSVGQFGILPLLSATLGTSLWAMAVALPLGLAAAIYLAEYASDKARGILKPALEVLAGVPTVVYGYFALTVVTPALRAVFGGERVEVYNTLSAGLAMGALILPLVASLCEDALSAVPRSLREAAYAMGATKLETSVRVVLPAAFSGVAAAFILALSRAVGETMIVALAAGAGPKLTLNPFVAAETMTGHIARISGGDLSYDSVDYKSLFAIALLLFMMTLVLNLVSRRIVRLRQEVYE
ncbi:MAG: phosphate ABC transporter permease subunit PstC [Spirochaetales bacterium]|nr:phosphate ABC transporter permease subunit PstC [Spirochaetales bacterium]MBP7264038.1 phosphate ABC transporter permease subunit PstC [Spirochaetia bacterium]